MEETNKKLSLYLETTIISYLASKPSRDIVTAGHQEISRLWWEKKSLHYNLFVSDFVVDEIVLGDEGAVLKRKQLISGIKLLQINEDVMKLATELIDRKALPAKAFQDAAHIAVSAVNRIDVILTWNFKHIANVEIVRAIRKVCMRLNYEPPLIYTPLELLGDEDGTV